MIDNVIIPDDETKKPVNGKNLDWSSIVTESVCTVDVPAGYSDIDFHKSQFIKIFNEKIPLIIVYASILICV